MRSFCPGSSTSVATTRADVGHGLARRCAALRVPVDDVVHRRRHAQPAAPGPVDEQRLARRAAMCSSETSGDSSAAATRGSPRADGQRLVGHQLRLHDDVGAPVERLDLVDDAHDGAMGERHEARRGHAHACGAPASTTPRSA